MAFWTTDVVPYERGYNGPTHMFVGMDTNGSIVQWNAQAEQTFGWTKAEAIGRNLADTIIPPAFREAHNNGMRRFLATQDVPRIRAATDLGNAPMAGAFHRAGYVNFERTIMMTWT